MFSRIFYLTDSVPLDDDFINTGEVYDFFDKFGVQIYPICVGARIRDEESLNLFTQLAPGGNRSIMYTNEYVMTF